jgi:ADP-ribose pyrophosphatase YjhB (NUDIX family)
MKYCSSCGTKVTLLIPAGDNRERHVCPDCDTIHYVNPRIITGCLPVYGDKVLLCKRAIEPRYGYWTLPAGFMENGESTEQGAIRECFEEANARVKCGRLYTITSIPSINQVHLFYLSELHELEFSAGEESLEVELFSEHEIPWAELSFTAVRITLQKYFEERKKDQFGLHSGVATRGDDGKWVWLDS